MPFIVEFFCIVPSVSLHAAASMMAECESGDVSLWSLSENFMHLVFRCDGTNPSLRLALKWVVCVNPVLNA